MMLDSNLSSNLSVLMASFGANLRREREMRGVPLEEIAAATKISVRCLQALEAGDFSKLPGGIFTRSFLRSYARYLGLDEEKVMAEFQVLAPRLEEADLSKLAPSKQKEPRPKSNVPVLVALLAVVVLAGGFVLYRSYWGKGAVAQSANSHQVSPASPQSAPASATPSAVSGTQAVTTMPGQSTAVPATQGTTTTTSSGTPGEPAANAASEPALTLQIAATDQTWVAVDADGKTAWQGVLKPNEIQTFKAKDSFDLRTGNAQGIILTLNGETLKPLGGRGEFKRVHLTQNDVKNPNP